MFRCVGPFLFVSLSMNMQGYPKIRNTRLLPRHLVTTLIIQEEQLLHCPSEQLLSSIHRYWPLPLSGRRETHKITSKCLRCFCFRPTQIEVKMEDLLTPRVSGFIQPFAVTGVNYAGPLQVRGRSAPRMSLYF